jgi:hypothetical protein
MDAPGTARLLAARLAALYLLSLVAVAGADLAWRPPSLGRLAGHALALGVALLLGGFLSDASSALAAAGPRRRVRLIALVFLPVPGLFALVAALAAPVLASRAAAGLALLQLGVLLVCEALSLELVALWGALVLTILAAAGGGLPALVSLPGFLLLASLFFSLDHVTRRLHAWPSVPAPALSRVLTDALRALAVPVLLLGTALVFLPSPSLAGPAGGQGPAFAGEVQRAYRWLVLLALLGGGTTLVVMRWLRGGGGDESPALVELPESHVLAEEILEPPAPHDPRYAPARGRVIRAYLRFLARAGEAGLRLERHLTPREIEDRVRRPEAPLRTLTGLFMDARYGPEEPAADAVLRAEAASREVCSSLRVRPRHRPRPGPPFSVPATGTVSSSDSRR